MEEHRQFKDDDNRDKSVEKLPPQAAIKPKSARELSLITMQVQERNGLPHHNSQESDSGAACNKADEKLNNDEERNRLLWEKASINAESTNKRLDFVMKDLIQEFSNVCPEILLENWLPDARYSGVNFASHILFKLGPEAHKLKRETHDSTWLFTFCRPKLDDPSNDKNPEVVAMTNNLTSIEKEHNDHINDKDDTEAWSTANEKLANEVLACKTKLDQYVKKHQSLEQLVHVSSYKFNKATDTGVYNVPGRYIKLTIEQASLLSLIMLEKIQAVEKENLILTPLAGACFSKEDLKAIADVLGLESEIQAANAINASAQDGGHYLASSLAEISHLVTVHATKNMQSAVCRDKIIKRYQRQYAESRKQFRWPVYENLVKYACGGLPFEFNLDKMISRFEKIQSARFQKK